MYSNSFANIDEWSEYFRLLLSCECEYGEKKTFLFCFARFFFSLFISTFHYFTMDNVFVMAIASPVYVIYHIVAAAAADKLTLAHSLHAFNSIHYAKLDGKLRATMITLRVCAPRYI